MSRPNCLCIEWPRSQRFNEFRSYLDLLAVSAFLAVHVTHGSWICIPIVRLYFVKLAMFCSDSCHKIHNLNGHKRYVNKNTSSVIMFTYLLSFCQQNIAKSNGHYSKMDRDLSKHQQGFAIHLIQPHESRSAYVTCPAGHKQLLSPSFRGCITEPWHGMRWEYGSIHSCIFMPSCYSKPRGWFPLTNADSNNYYLYSHIKCIDQLQGNKSTRTRRNYDSSSILMTFLLLTK